MINTQRCKFLLKIAIFTLILIAVWIIFLPSNSDKFKVYFFNVGQGDASLLMLADSTQILIDGGPNSSILKKLGQVMPLNDKTIEYMVLTHPHADHLNGLAEVLKRYQVKTFIFNGLSSDSHVFSELTKRLNEQEARFIIIDQPYRLEVSSELKIDFIYPDKAVTINETGGVNSGSLVALVQFKNQRILFMGDAPQEVEKYLITKGLDVTAEIIKISHHGSISSSKAEFINAVKPSWGIISVGENSYGHPHFRTLKTLRDANVQILRTDEKGDIGFMFKGFNLPKIVFQHLR